MIEYCVYKTLLQRAGWTLCRLSRPPMPFLYIHLFFLKENTAATFPAAGTLVLEAASRANGVVGSNVGM